MDGGNSLEEQQLSGPGAGHNGPGAGHSGRGAGPNGPEVVDDRRGGFVLALVVLLLFGIGVAAAGSRRLAYQRRGLF